MGIYPRILSVAAAQPGHQYSQDEILAFALEQTLGMDGAHDTSQSQRARHIERLFAASRVERRQSAVDLRSFYRGPRTTGERMMEYQRAAYAVGRAAMEACLEEGEQISVQALTDLITVSCTGYSAPGLDIQLARDLGMPLDTRRVVIGHMGCYGAIVGLRQAVAAVQARPDAMAAVLSVELSSLHFAPVLDADMLTSFALFGDAAAAVVLAADGASAGPRVVDTYCMADFSSADQMSWTISDFGFIMGLSPRVPVTLRRHVAGAMARLLDPHDLHVGDVAHWLIHPGGPSILEAIQRRLELSDEQMSLSWKVLGEHGNCSSTTVLLILDELMRSGRARPGDWGVMMAFGPGLTLETCLLQF